MSVQLNVRDSEDPSGFGYGTELPKHGTIKLIAKCSKKCAGDLHVLQLPPLLLQVFKVEFYFEGLLVLVRDGGEVLRAQVGRGNSGRAVREELAQPFFQWAAFSNSPLVYVEQGSGSHEIQVVFPGLQFIYTIAKEELFPSSLFLLSCVLNGMLLSLGVTVLAHLTALQYLGGKYLCSKPFCNLSLILFNVSTRVARAFRLPSCNEISLPFCKLFVLIYLILIVHPLGLSPSLSTRVCSDIFLKSE